MIHDRAVIGSRPGVDVHVGDPTVSRIHAELQIRENGLWVVDQGSTNGTNVSGVRVTGARLLDNTMLQVGGTEIRVHLSTPPVPVDLWPNESFGRLVGRSTVARELFATLDRVAKTDQAVLVEGETGTGKEEVARAIHAASPRAGGPFVVIDCGVLTETLLEAELFGHVRGAFTGAEQDREGSIAAADGGTVFLDEIGELPLELQPKLLRVLETSTLRPLGATEYRKVNVRFVSATHQNLREMVNAGTFREDLYFRLAVFPLTVPPLRERREDIPLLVAQFLPEGSVGALTPELVRMLAERPWKGNVRELRSFVQRAQALGVAAAFEAAPGSKGERRDRPLPFPEARDLALAEFERKYVADTVARAGGDVAKAAELAGVTPSYLYRIMRRHQLG
ncbi:MAG: sigma 54-interacting transcriptional regulator [Polyangiales bacterium]|nr:sigma 54-interacting transcriptional regulator [Myxococcales bacterium]